MKGVIADGCPVTELKIAGKVWKTIIDTGFNSDLELPIELFDIVAIRFRHEGESMLAGDVTIVQEFYEVQIPFDGEMVHAIASFVEGNTILLGTGLLMQYVLHIDFPDGTVSLERRDY